MRLDRLRIPNRKRFRRRQFIDLTGIEDFEIGKTISAEGLGAYEPEIFAMICALLESQRPGVRFVDIGANVGVFSLAARAIFGTKVEVHAFEPLPILAEFIETASEGNDLGIRVHRSALSSATGTATLHISLRSDTSNSLNERFRPYRETLEVPVTTIDHEFLTALDIQTILKIDTESTEPDVLAGGRQFIERHRPAIICEVLAGRTESALEQFLSDTKYLGIHLTDNPDWDGLAEVVGDPTYRFRDWLFVPERPSAQVRRLFSDWYRVWESQ